MSEMERLMKAYPGRNDAADELECIEAELEEADNRFDELDRQIGVLHEVEGILNDEFRAVLRNVRMNLEVEYCEIQERQNDLIFRRAALAAMA